MTKDEECNVGLSNGFRFWDNQTVPAPAARRGRVMCEMNDFLGAVRAAPDEDAPRLVFADWLDEHDRPEWAEFIRVQCELARMAPADPRRPELTARQDWLINTHRDEWLAPFRGRSWKAGFTSRRGFVERLSLEQATGDPPNTADDLRTLLDRPVCAAITAVRVTAGDIGSEMPNVLAAAPQLSALRRLELAYPNVGDEGLTELARSPHLGNLTVLRVEAGYTTYYNRPVHSAGVRVLAESPTLTRLQELELKYNAIDADGACALAGSPNLFGLKRLILKGNRIGDRGLRALSGSPRLRRISELDVSCNGIGDEGVEFLAGSPVLAGLRRLSIGSDNAHGRNSFGDRGALALARSNYLENLEELHINEMDRTIGPAALDVLRWRFGGRLKTAF
jgi:uncharacterized protein (TIGR02996 family)